MVKDSLNIPKEVRETIKALNDAGFEAYAVGGCVRDLVLSDVEGLSIEPYDWDITTNAKPEEIQKIFKNSVYENEFGTVAINTESDNPSTKIIEITTYRVEEKYTDKRHPDVVKFTSKLDNDLARRDFTVNAMALKIKNQKSNLKTTTKNSELANYEIIDLFGGQKDIENKIIRAVGDPDERFNEDTLRLMRAVRFAVQLSAQGGPASGWDIEPKTAKAIMANAGDIVAISKERIRDELIKI